MEELTKKDIINFISKHDKISPSVLNTLLDIYERENRLDNSFIDGTIEVLASKTETLNSNQFQGCANLTSVYLPEVKELPANCFSSCRQLKNIYVPKVTSITTSTFASTGLEVVDFPSLLSMGTFSFIQSTLLRRVDCSVLQVFQPSAFSGCNNLVDFIIRKDNKPCVCGLSPTTYLKNPDLKIYVPRALIEQYKVAPNWSYLADKFVALEDYTVDGTTTGELREETTEE